MTEKIYSIPEIQTILFPVFRRNNVKKSYFVRLIRQADSLQQK